MCECVCWLAVALSHSIKSTRIYFVLFLNHIHVTTCETHQNIHRKIVVFLVCSDNRLPLVSNNISTTLKHLKSFNRMGIWDNKVSLNRQIARLLRAVRKDFRNTFRSLNNNTHKQHSLKIDRKK